MLAPTNMLCIILYILYIYIYIYIYIYTTKNPFYKFLYINFIEICKRDILTSVLCTFYIKYKLIIILLKNYIT